MDIRKKYTEETGKLYYKEATLEFEWDGDYVEWLEQNLLKLLTIPAVVGRSEQLFCHHKGKYTLKSDGNCCKCHLPPDPKAK